MISVKYAIIMAVGAFATGSFVASPLPQAIAAVIATDVQCTGCVGTPDLAGNAVTATKIKDSEVKAAEIAANAVGASEIAADSVGGSELIGVTKLLFGQCAADSTEGAQMVASGERLEIGCAITGVDSDDRAMASNSADEGCFGVTSAEPSANLVIVSLVNECSTTEQFGTGQEIGIIVFDK